MKKLEKNDLTKRVDNSENIPEEETYEDEQRSEIEEIIAETDVNSMTPMEALKLIYDLKNKLNG